MDAEHENTHISLPFASAFEEMLLANTVLHSNTDFADIFIESSKERVSVPEIIIPRNRSDQKIYDMYIQMRRLYKVSGIMAVHGLDAFVFCKQGRLMQDFEDDYKEIAEFNADIPTYQKLSYEQFRTYFTWRTRARKGIVDKTYLSYVILYIFEIINNIGIKNDNEGLVKLTYLWTEYINHDESINEYLKVWFKDYYITRHFDKPFHEFITQYKVLCKIYVNEWSADHFALYEDNTNYKYKDSEFYNEETAKDIHGCFNHVIECINKRHGDDYYFDEIVRTASRGVQWIPFRNAICDSPEPIEKRNIYKIVHFSPNEVYWLDYTKWRMSSDLYFKAWSQLVIGHIIKKTESFIRAKTGFKKLKSEPTKAGKERLIKLLGKEDYESIDILIAEYYNEKHRISVTVDQSRLEEIREGSLETQERLLEYTVYEEDAEPAADTQNETDDTEEHDADPWISLIKQLTSVEKGMLEIIINGGGLTNAAKYARDNYAMPEILADSINEKAAEIINDNILELSDTAVIYEEYLDFLKGAMQNETE